MQSTKLAAALDAAAKGFRVFPIEPNTKRPKHGLPWKEKATSDPARIQSWWDENPDFNIGVATGDGVLVVDADTKDGRPGLASLDLLDMMGLPTSLRVGTPSGGVHVYLKSDRPHRNRVDSIVEYPGIDIRAVDEHGRTGYVVGPGSVVDGKEYQVLSSADVGTCPPWFDEILAAAPARRMEHTDQPLVDLDLPENVERANHWLANNAQEAIEGAGGDDTTFRVACRLRDFGLSKETALESLLEHWNETKASPPWQPDELEAKVENAFEYASGGWGAGTAAGEFSGLEIDVGEPPKGVRNKHAPTPGDKHEPRLVVASYFATLEKPERQFLVKDLIPHKNVTTLSGDGSTGKSLIAMQLSVAVTQGALWLGESVLKSGPVVYFSAEDDEEETHIRLKDICGSEGIDLADVDNLHIALMAGEDALLATEHVQGASIKKTPLFVKLRRWMTEIRPRLLVLDNLVDIFGGNQNSPPLARQFIGMLRGLAIEFDCSVLLLAHPSLSGMASGKGTAGTTAWNNSVRSRMYLQRIFDDNNIEPDPNARCLEVKKANYGPTGTQIEIRWERGRFTLTRDFDFGDLEDDAEPETKIERAERVFRNLLAQFLNEGRTVSPSPSSSYAPTVFSKHPGACGVNKSYMEMAMNNLLKSSILAIEKQGSPSRQKQVLVFARGIPKEPTNALREPTDASEDQERS